MTQNILTPLNKNNEDEVLKDILQNTEKLLLKLIENIKLIFFLDQKVI